MEWEPSYDLKRLITEMIISNITLMKKEGNLRAGGFNGFKQMENI
jgi:hypothetical protein